MEKTSLTDVAVKIQNVWKIFGNISNEALEAIQNKSISKQEQDWLIDYLNKLLPGTTANQS